MLGVSAGTIQYWVVKEEKTIPEIYAMLGRKPKLPKERKPRESAQMLWTKERMAILLEMSGIANRNDAVKDLVIKRVGNHGHHRVDYNGQLIGVYAYRIGSLSLSGGQGIPLGKLEWEDAKLVRGSDGLWHVHPDTHRIMIQQAVRPIEDEDDLLGVYSNAKQAEEMRSTPRQTYEGFGKKLTAAQWERLLGVSHTTLWAALQRGESIEDFAERRGIKVARTPKIEEE
jgi:hypothetical protein